MDDWIGPLGGCGQAMWTLLGGRDQAPRGAWSRALAHTADCPACGDRLQRLAAALLAPAGDAVPCAECQARLPDWLARRAAGTDPALADPRTASHLADCPRCMVVLDLVAPAATGWTGELAPEPPRYPQFDTSFLDRPARPRSLHRLGAWWSERWERAIAPAARPRESPVSAGLLGAAVAVLVLLALVAGTWVLLRPERRPLPLAPWRAATATATPSATATATPGGTATGRAVRATAGPSPRAQPLAGTGPTPTAGSATAAPEPTERRRTPAPVPAAASSSPEPYPGWQPTATRAPYPGPSEAPYPGPSDVPPTDNPYP